MSHPTSIPALNQPADSIRSLSWPSAEGPIDVQLAALWRSARLGPVVEQLRRRILAGPEHQIDAGQFRMLDMIAAHEPCSLGALAGHLGINPSTATRAVNQLEADGLVEKLRANHDQRSVNVTMSVAGRNLHRYFVDRAYGVYQDIFAVFDEDEKNQLAGYLDRMLASTSRVLASERRPATKEAR